MRTLGSQTATESLRCPFCVEAQSFLRMIRHVEGRFICDRCGHVERPEDLDFSCNCGRCQEMFVFSHA